MKKGFTRKFNPLNILAERELDLIEKGFLDVLERTGLKFEGDSGRALKLFDEAGCVVDYDEKLVKFPAGLVRDSIQKCPSSFHVEARDPQNDLVIGCNTVYFQPGPGMWYIDIDTFEPRLPTREEFYNAVRIYDALPNLHHFHNNSPNTSIEGVHPLLSTIETYAARARYSTKVNYFSQSNGNDIFNIEIAKVVGAKGLFGIGSISPLCWGDDAINSEIRAVEAGMPVISCGGSIWGASAPATIAGELVTNIAESLGPLILAQIINPGHPVIPGTFTFPANMSNGAPFFCNITIALASAAFAQFWRRYRIPTQLIEAAIPNSKCIDFQSGYEKGMIALAQAQAGGSIVWIHGTVHGELTAHPVQAILDDDIAGMIGRFLEGIEVNDETLSIELIEQVGPMPGFFLDKTHTRKMWRKDQFIPASADILTLAEWRNSGKKAAIDIARERMAEILRNHKISVPLTRGQEEDIDKILEDAYKFYKKNIDD
jgi:trimethylamine--corrinoid protein Co-methyltransferase